METRGLPEDQIAIARDGTTTIYEVKFRPSQFGATEFAEGYRNWRKPLRK